MHSKHIAAVHKFYDVFTTCDHYFENDRIVRTRHLEDFFGVSMQLLAVGAKPMAAGGQGQ